MKNYFPALAIALATLSLVLTFLWKEARMDKSSALSAAAQAAKERDTAVEAMMRSDKDADQQYAQNGLLRAAIEGLGYELPDELKPLSPNGEVLAVGSPDGN